MTPEAVVGVFILWMMYNLMFCASRILHMMSYGTWQ